MQAHASPATCDAKPRSCAGAMVQQVVQRACAKLQTCKELDDEPDVVDDLFLLASSVLQHCPGLLVEAPALPHLLACCNSAILIQEKWVPAAAASPGR